jgi:hypothetical protein
MEIENGEPRKTPGKEPVDLITLHFSPFGIKTPKREEIEQAKRRPNSEIWWWVCKAVLILVLIAATGLSIFFFLVIISLVISRTSSPSSARSWSVIGEASKHVIGDGWHLIVDVRKRVYLRSRRREGTTSILLELILAPPGLLTHHNGLVTHIIGGLAHIK